MKLGQLVLGFGPKHFVCLVENIPLDCKRIEKKPFHSTMFMLLKGHIQDSSMFTIVRRACRYLVSCPKGTQNFLLPCRYQRSYTIFWISSYLQAIALPGYRCHLLFLQQAVRDLLKDARTLSMTVPHCPVSFTETAPREQMSQESVMQPSFEMNPKWMVKCRPLLDYPQ